MTAPGGEPAVPLPAAVRMLLERHGLADLPVRAAARSATRVDTGRWFSGERVWVALVGDRLLLLAPGPRPLVQLLPAGAAVRAGYNHVTGGLALPAGAAAGPPRELPAVRLDPLVARSLLAAVASEPPPGSRPDA